MPYKFKYHPDNWIGINGIPSYPFAEFIEVYPDFPITEGNFFEYHNDKRLEIIHSTSTGTFVGTYPQNLAPYGNLISALEAFLE